MPPRLFDVALEAAEMGWWRYECEGQVCVFSARAQQLYGLDSPHFVHDRAGVERLLHPEDLEGMWQAVAAACDPSGNGRYNVEYRVRRREGGWRWLSVWGLVEFDGEGPQRHAVAITGASHDITERKRSEIFLDAQNRSLEMIVAGAPLSDTLSYLAQVVERQSDGQAVASILFLDDEKRLHNGASPSLPADYLAAIDGLKVQADLGTCSAAAATGTVVVTPDIETDPKWAAIKHLPLGIGFPAAWSQPIKARDGRVLGTFGTYFRERREPTPQERQSVEILSRTAALAIERARTDEAMRTADRRKDEFIATLSHELRNPLAPLRMAVHLLRSTRDAGQERLLDTMERQVAQLVRLVDDLLEVSRISRGAVELRYENLDIGSIVRLAVETTEPVLHAARHRLTLELPDEQILVRGDRVRLAQILGNLLNNAAKYTDAGGHIVVGVRATADRVSVAVRDNGAGIEPAAIPELFELFVRGDRSNRHREGLGIGLALARRLADMHGGTLEGASAGPGQGSEFTLRLPRVGGGARAERKQAAGSPAGRSSLRSRVLVVDDNGDGAEMLALLLTEIGCDAHVAHDGRSAESLAGELRPDVVLLDIGLPDVTGREVCRRIRSQPWAKHMMIVAVTGWGQATDVDESLRAGFDAHLVKPVDPTALTALLRKNAPTS